ncbi:MAG: SMI1/KNR4 family protein [Hydrotalea flava]|nr:SMI1/KNR4 family protein [Hydrotalea flava]
MKTLTSNSKPLAINNDVIAEVENQFRIKFPDYFVSFLKQYGGTSTKEIVFNDKFWVNFFLPLRSDAGASIEEIMKGHTATYNENYWIPFAIDSGGWSYCIALKETIKDQIWIDKFDSGEENSFEFVAPSFENFIDNLKTEEDAFS